MPRFLSIAVVLCALFRLSPVLAGSPIDASTNLMHKRQAAPRGRPNHADEYGYPHGRGDHSGVRGPVPVTNHHMTPGGYKDDRPSNAGAACSRDRQCSTGISNARAVCSAGKCAHQCLGRTEFDGAACTGQIVSRRCSFDRQCATNIPDATGKCKAGHCTFACGSGFYAFGSTCKAADKTCGSTACPDIPGGYTTCSGNTCVPHCEAHLGYKMFCNADNSVCQCTDTANDPDNCGAPGKVCPGSYNNKGRRYCANGTCGLSCHRLAKVTPLDGAPYCA